MEQSSFPLDFNYSINPDFFPLHMKVQKLLMWWIVLEISYHVAWG